jgi:hypothetical protein
MVTVEHRGPIGCACPALRRRFRTIAFRRERSPSLLPARVSALCRSDLDVRLFGLDGSGRSTRYRARTPFVGSLRRPRRPDHRAPGMGTRAPRRPASHQSRRGRPGRPGGRGARGRPERWGPALRGGDRRAVERLHGSPHPPHRTSCHRAERWSACATRATFRAPPRTSAGAARPFRLAPRGFPQTAWAGTSAGPIG